MGRAGAASAALGPAGSPRFLNPAGLAGLKGGHATIGVTLINVDGGFTDDILQRTSDLNDPRSEEHTSELQSQSNLVCRLLLEKKIPPVAIPQKSLPLIHPSAF